jgi:hypothetical protein
VLRMGWASVVGGCLARVCMGVCLSVMVMVGVDRCASACVLHICVCVSTWGEDSYRLLLTSMIAAECLSLHQVLGPLSCCSRKLPGCQVVKIYCRPEAILEWVLHTEHSLTCRGRTDSTGSCVRPDLSVTPIMGVLFVWSSLAGCRRQGTDWLLPMVWVQS